MSQKRNGLFLSVALLSLAFVFTATTAKAEFHYSGEPMTTPQAGTPSQAPAPSYAAPEARATDNTRAPSYGSSAPFVSPPQITPPPAASEKSGDNMLERAYNDIITWAAEVGGGRGPDAVGPNGLPRTTMETREDMREAGEVR